MKTAFETAAARRLAADIVADIRAAYPAAAREFAAYLDGSDDFYTISRGISAAEIVAFIDNRRWRSAVRAGFVPAEVAEIAARVIRRNGGDIRAAYRLEQYCRRCDTGLSPLDVYASGLPCDCVPAPRVPMWAGAAARRAAAV